MTLVTTLTSRGQVTVPKEIRDALGLKPRDKVEIFVKDGSAWLRKAEPSLQVGSGGVSYQSTHDDENVTIESDER